MATYDSFKRITGDAVIDGQVQNADLATSAVQTSELAAGAVETDKLAAGAVGTDQLSSTFDISGKTVTYRNFASGDISNSAAIAGSKFATGAMADNLGGLPLNKAGGDGVNSMVGTLTLPSGNSGSAALQRDGDANTGISFSGNTVYVRAGGTTGLQVNSNDTVQRPATPAFHASGTSGWRYANSYGGLRWRSLNGNMSYAHEQRGGSNFSNGNGRFTAPVAGFYQFNFNTYARNDRNNNQGYYHMSFGINGGNAMVGGRTPHGIFGHSNAQRYYPNGTHMSLGTYLNAGQYVDVRVYWHNNQTRFHGAHTHFDGFLVA
tara:strand:+ start:3467 stop:4423 length:957 start_codon:yes stop_codon:yes gene_type:complete